MSSYEVIHADVLTWAREYKQRIERGEAEPFHALVSDPPFEMSFMNKRWDGTGISFQPETWATLAEVLHPGAFLMVFAGSRGWHRLACAMEDANLILQPTIFIWLNSQSFPKASRVRKAPKPERARRYRWLGWLGRLGNWLLRKRGEPPRYYLDYIWQGHRYGGQILKDCATPIIVAQKPWDGKRLDCIVRTGAGAINVDGGRIGTRENLGRISPGIRSLHRQNYEQGIRPQCYYENHESRRIDNSTGKGRWPSNFALVHRAPGPDGEGGCVRAGTKRVGDGETVYNKEDSVTPSHNGYCRPNASMYTHKKEGKLRSYGEEEVDAWRCEEGCVCVKLGEQSGESISKQREGARSGKDAMRYGTFTGQVNVTMGHNDKGTAARFYHQSGWEHERAECAEGCVCRKLDEQAGERKSALFDMKHPVNPETSWKMTSQKYNPSGGYNDSGGVSRFYHNADWTAEIAERLATSDPVRYCPKAAKRERNEGLDGFFWRKDKASPTGFVRISQEEWEALGEEEERIKKETGKRVSLRARGNIHPTQKPIALTKWLAQLLAPPEEYAPRRLVIPFCGIFSEGVGAIRSGQWEEIVGIDFIEDYVDMSEVRAAFWSGQPMQLELMED